MSTSVKSIHIFCVVVDNFGDIGVCWRMARQMSNEYPFQITLWVDDLKSFHTICDEVNPELAEQLVEGVTVRHWTDNAFTDIQPEQTGDVVIEGFGCTLPSAYVAAMAKRAIPPVWLNVEYLSAEEWVEGCHGLVSMHPSLPLKKFFFFPGFTNKTGGLLMDKKTWSAKTSFDQNSQQRWAYLKQRGIPVDKDALYLSVFCYPQAPLDSLLIQLQKSKQKVIVVIPENTASASLADFCGRTLQAGEQFVQENLTISCIPFSDQSQYDYLLWSCDINFVRGEDSFVRAQWAGKPLIWQIYPQEEKVHMIKLNAFLDHYLGGMPEPLKKDIQQLWYSWNGESPNGITYQEVDQLLNNFANWQHYSEQWMQHLLKNGDLVTNIISFSQK